MGCPVSRSLITCCVCLELRSLPSASITRLQRYYEPLRHPSAPGLSLTGVRLAIPGHALGLPVLRTLSLWACRRHYPGAADGCTRRSNPPIRISLPRSHCRVGLHIVLFEACSAFTHVAACTLARSPIRDRYPKASDTSSPPCLLRLLPAGAGAGRGLHPLEKRRLVTAHVESGHWYAAARTAPSRPTQSFIEHGAAPVNIHIRRQRSADEADAL
jgi:hypothetical protein